VLTAAYERHPERFKGKMPKPMLLPDAVWINKPSPASDGVILSCYLLSTNDIITPEVYFFFRRSYEKTCTITDGFQRIFGAITEKGKNKDTISKGSVFMAACFPWAVVS
jgi:hypothetical protein